MLNVNVNEILGKTVTRVEGKAGCDWLELHMSDGTRYALFHEQDCCETVALHDIVGDLDDLVGEPLLEAEEVTSQEHPAGYQPSRYEDSFTWTFYKFGTRKGSVTLRWLGESNGYYSESVSFARVK